MYKKIKFILIVSLSAFLPLFAEPTIEQLLKKAQYFDLTISNEGKQIKYYKKVFEFLKRNM